MWIVYKRFEQDDYQVLEVPQGLTANQVDRRVGSYNWFASRKSTAQEAITQAKLAGFKFGKRPQIHR